MIIITNKKNNLNNRKFKKKINLDFNYIISHLGNY